MTQQFRNYTIEFSLIGLLLLAVLFFGYLGMGLLPRELEETFSSSRALDYVEAQTALGPRVAGSEAALDVSDWYVERLTNAGWNVAILPFPVEQTEGDTAEAEESSSAHNLVAVRPPSAGTADRPPLWLATFYDTVSSDVRGGGANAGASGAAVLIELARSLNVEATGQTVCFVLLGAGRSVGAEAVSGMDYLLRSFSGEVPTIAEPCRDPRSAVLLDAVGGAAPVLAENGDASLNAALQDATVNLSGDTLVTRSLDLNELRVEPLLQAGIPTTAITSNSPSPENDVVTRVEVDTLERVGRILQVWLESGVPN